MALKAVALDDAGTQHLILGLNREDIESILQGDVFTFARGVYPEMTQDSDIVVLFAETDQELKQRFPPSMRPV